MKRKMLIATVLLAPAFALAEGAAEIKPIYVCPESITADLISKGDPAVAHVLAQEGGCLVLQRGEELFVSPYNPDDPSEINKNILGLDRDVYKARGTVSGIHVNGFVPKSHLNITFD